MSLEDLGIYYNDEVDMAMKCYTADFETTTDKDELRDKILKSKIPRL